MWPSELKAEQRQVEAEVNALQSMTVKRRYLIPFVIRSGSQSAVGKNNNRRHHLQFIVVAESCITLAGAVLALQPV